MSDSVEKEISSVVRRSRLGGVFSLVGGFAVLLGIVLVLVQANQSEARRESDLAVLQEDAKITAADAAEAKIWAATVIEAAEAAAAAAAAAAEEAEAAAAAAAQEAEAAKEANAESEDVAEILDTVEIPEEPSLQSPAVIVDVQELDSSLLSLENSEVSLAGPDSVYVTNVTYGGQTYSALLKYVGGTTVTIEKVYGPHVTLIPDSVRLAATELSFEMPNVLRVSYIEVGGVGYSGELRYAGDNRLMVVGLQRVTLPLTAADKAQVEVSQMHAENESLRALITAQQKNIAALKDELEAAGAAAAAQATVAAQAAAADQAAAAAQTVADE